VQTPSIGVPGARARSWDEYRVNVGHRLVTANPNATYTGVPPEPLLAIPVLEIDLNRDGSVRNVRVQRAPSQAEDTTQLAIDAVRRAGPFGDVSHLPQPWRFSEVFLFRDDRKFKPRSLDQ
jgi:protein TonB